MCVVRTFFNDENAQRPPQFNKSPRKVGKKKKKKTKNKTQRGSGEETKRREILEVRGWVQGSGAWAAGRVRGKGQGPRKGLS